MIHILFVFAGHFNGGGTEAVMFNIYDFIDKNRFHIDFLLLDDSEDTTPESKRLLMNGSNIYYIIRRKKSWFKHRKQLEQFFEHHSYDIVHTHMDAISDEVLLAAKKKGARVRIAHSHSSEYQIFDKNKLVYLLHKLFLTYERYRTRKYANYYLACSEKAGQWLFGSQICLSNNYMIYRNAIDVEMYAYNPHIREQGRNKFGIGNKKVIGHVGRFSYEKNHSFLLDIFNQIHLKDKNTFLIMVGDGPTFSEIKLYIQQLRLENDVMLLGKRDDINFLLQVFDIFIFPSHFEGLGIALIEAEAAGLPCLASDTIPKMSNVNNHVKYMNLNKPASEWADTALEMLATVENQTRSAPIDAFCQKGFDIHTNIKELERFYNTALKYNSIQK